MGYLLCNLRPTADRISLSYLPEIIENMSSRSLLEIHTIEVHFNVDRVTLKTDNMEPYFLTVKVSKLISSKNVPLVVTAHGLEPKSPLVVDVLMQYDSILGCY